MGLCDVRELISRKMERPRAGIRSLMLGGEQAGRRVNEHHRACLNIFADPTQSVFMIVCIVVFEPYLASSTSLIYQLVIENG
jgi:hypothetical protein